MHHLSFAVCLLIDLITFLAGFAKPLARLHIGAYEEWTPGQPLKILLVGYNGARNTGSEVGAMDPFLARAASLSRWVLGHIKKDLEGQYDR